MGPSAMQPGSQPGVRPLTIRELPSTERPRERMRSLGAAALSTTELMAVVLGTGGAGCSALECARLVLESAGGSLGRLAGTPLAALTRVPGVGGARASAVHAALEIGRRMAAEARESGVPLRGPRDVAAAFSPRLQDLPVEEFHIAILDAQHRLERDGMLKSRGFSDATYARMTQRVSGDDSARLAFEAALAKITAK